MNKIIKLGKKAITTKSAPYVIAEIGVNHEGSVDQAKRLIDQAKIGGADAAKFQSYKANKLASKHSPAYWDTSKEPATSQYLLFQRYDNFGPDEYFHLAEYCRQVDIDFLSTPFDDDAIDFLDSLVPFFKIASADLTNIPFLRKVASKGKPIVLSTGASTLSEIEIAVNEVKKYGCEDLALLHCILNYPTVDTDANLSMINSLKKVFPDHIIGYSDHTLPDLHMTALVSAFLLGAVIIEKHFTHDKALPGNDHYHAMDKNDLCRFIEIINKVVLLKGNQDHKSPIPSEAIARENARRSLVLRHDVKKGHILQESDITYKRPGLGISPLYWDQVLGSYCLHDLEADHILAWSDILRTT